MSSPPAPDYLAIGHIAVDLTPDVQPSLGGAALYAALTAARFGLRAAVLTRGNFGRHGDEIADDLAHIAAEIEIIVQAADQPTVFVNQNVAGRRRQQLLSWAEPIDLTGLPPTWRSCRIIHLAPIAQEIDARQAGRLSPEYLGTTPQGWMREWQHGSGGGSAGGRSGAVSLRSLRLPTEIVSRLDALVLNSEEHTLARDVLEAVGRRGLAGITRGAAGAQLIDRGRSYDVPAFPVPVRSDVGAGDVFAAMLFLLRADRVPTSQAGRLAAAAAALKIRGEGPSAVPSREEVEDFLQRAEARRPTRARRG